MKDRTICQKDDPNWPFPCACNTCSRAAAHAWVAYVESPAFVLGGPHPAEFDPCQQEKT